MLQLQDIQGRSCSRLPRSLGNAGDLVFWAFPTCWVEALFETQRVNKMMDFLEFLDFTNCDIRAMHEKIYMYL